MPARPASTQLTSPPPPPAPAVAAGLRGTAPGDAPDAYLGVLFSEEGLRLYGYVTNTRAKLVVAVDGPAVRDDEMRAVRMCGCRWGGWVEGGGECSVHSRAEKPARRGARRQEGRAAMPALADGHPRFASRTRLPAPPQLFRRMHAAYVDAVCNPFYSAGAPLASPAFDASIRTIATGLGAA